MADCGNCLHEEVCATAETCDGHVPKCKYFMDKRKFRKHLGNMNIAAALEFALAASQFGIAIVASMHGNHLWWCNFASGVFCLCMGIHCLDKK